MARTTAQRFYLTTADQDGTWGTDIRALDSTAGASNATTINAAGTSTTANVVITCDPYSTRSSTVADNGFGWAFNRDAASTDGMDSIAGARRIIPAGTWIFQGTISIPVAGTATGTITASFRVAVYRVSSDGATRTLLFTINTTTAQSTGLAAVNATQVNGSISQGLILLEAGETLQAHVQTVSTQVAGLAGATVAANITLTTVNTTFLEVPAPGVRTMYEQALTATITPAAAAVGKAVKKLLASLGAPSGAVNFKTSRSYSGSIAPAATVLKKLIRNTPFAGTITSTGVLVKRPGKFLASTITSAATVARLPIKRVNGLITPAATASFRLFLIRSGSITPHGALIKRTSKAFAGFFYGTGSTGGGTTIVKKVRMFIFDD